MAENAVVIPVEGLLEVIAKSASYDPEVLLKARGEGVFTTLNFERDGDPMVVHMLHNELGPVNHRAREAFALLGGPHVIFTGTVVFNDVPEEKVYELIQRVSA